MVMSRVLAAAVVTVIGLPLVAGAPVVPDEAPTEAAASAAARQGSKSVLVESETDETTEVRANPDGTFTMVQHVRPVRVRRGDGWVGVDTTLVRRADGVISPQATVVDLKLSGGGPGSAGRPLVTAGKDGAEVGLEWDTDLPEPTLDGPTATYSEVLPGVDLRVTADVVGFSEVLVVKTAQAATNPKLRKITFGSHAAGLAVTATAEGLRATDAAGTVVFTGDASRMWDSGRRTATMDFEVTGSAIAIVPDQTFLTADDTSYPVYLDPSYRCTNCGKTHHNVVQSYPDWANNHNFDRTDDVFNALMAGYVCDGECFNARTYLRMNTAPLARRVIHGAYMHVDVVNSFFCAPLATSTQLWWSQWMDWNTTWNAQPALIAHLSSGNATNNAGHCPSNGGMDLPAKTAIEYSANNSVGETTFALIGDREIYGSSPACAPYVASSPCTAWRRFGLNPYLIVDYNSRPNVPTSLGMEGFGPRPGDAIPCVTGNSRPWIPTRTPRLRAVVSDPDGGSLNAVFHVLRGPKDTNPPEVGKATKTGVPSGSFAEATVTDPRINTDEIYTWYLDASDGALSSSSGKCEFSLDTVKPLLPTVSSDQYPADRPGGGVGQAGTFTLASNAGTSDTAYYLYSLTAQGDDPQTKVTPAALNGSVTVSWTPALSGPQTLSVRAVDRAGNRSDITRYKIVVSDFQVGISGKVAQWSFEDSLADTAGARSLTHEGPPPGATFGPGHQGQGVVLDRANTEFYRAGDALVRTDNSFTVSAWAKLTTADQHFTIASQDGDRLSGFYLHYHLEQNRWTMSMSDRDSEIEPVWFGASSLDPPTLGVWTHITGVFDASARRIRLYVNGALNAEGSVPAAAPWNATGPFVVGAGKTWGHREYHLNGELDSVRVHARALTTAEIMALCNGTATANPTAEYLFEGNLTNTGITNDLAPATAMSYGAGYAGRASVISESAGSWTQTSGPVVNTTGSFAVAAWVKLDNKDAWHHVVSQDGNRMSGFMIRYTSGVDRWFVFMPKTDTDDAAFQWVTSQAVPQVGVWTHLVAVHDASRHKLLLYVDGVLDSQTDLTSTIDARGQFLVGAAKWAGGRTGAFAGGIDEVNVYDGALTADEAANLANVPVERARYALDETSGTVANDSVGGAQAPLYGTGITWGQNYGAGSANFSGLFTEHAGTVAGSGPLAQWSMNNTVADSSGNGRDLVHANNTGPVPATYGAGRINEGVTLNGVDQRLTTSGPVVDTSRSYSVSAWVKLDRTNGRFTIASQDGTIASPFYLKYSNSLNRWVFAMTDGNRTNPVMVRATSSVPPNVGYMTHLLGVYDSAAGKARLYVNGVLDGEAAVTATWQSTVRFAVGRALVDGAQVDYFPGTIDEVRVYDRVLTAADAHSLWDLGSNIRMPRPAAFRTDQSFTVAAWVRHGGIDAAARTALSADGRRSPFLLGYRAEYNRWGLLVFAAPNGATGWILSDNVASTYVDPNGWVHLAAVYDAPTRKLRLLVNGVEQSSVPLDGTRVAKVDPANPPPWYAGANTTMRDTGQGLLIGRAIFDGMVADYWKGAIRDVRVFSGVLPDACDNAPTCLSQLPWQ